MKLKNKVLVIAVLMTVIAVLMTVAVGAYYVHRARGVSCALPSCWLQLVQLQSAKNQWEMDNGAVPGAPVMVENILLYLPAGMPTCDVANAKYILGKVGEEPLCTIHGSSSHFKFDRVKSRRP